MRTLRHKLPKERQNSLGRGGGDVRRGVTVRMPICWLGAGWGLQIGAQTWSSEEAGTSPGLGEVPGTSRALLADGKRVGRRQPLLPQPFSLLPHRSWRGRAPRAAEKHPKGGSRLLLPATHRSPLGLEVTPGPRRAALAQDCWPHRAHAQRAATWAPSCWRASSCQKCKHRCPPWAFSGN